MRLLVRLGLALLVVGSMSLVIGASAFTGTEADRTVSVNVVEDGDAYVGLEYSRYISVGPDRGDRGRQNGTGSDAETQRRQSDALSMNNQFGIDTNIEVIGDTADYPELRYENDGGKNTAALGSGGAETFDAVVTCENRTGDYSRTAEVTITAEGDGVSAEVTREVTVECERNAGNNGKGPGGNSSQGPNGNNGKGPSGNNGQGPNGNSSQSQNGN